MPAGVPLPGLRVAVQHSLDRRTGLRIELALQAEHPVPALRHRQRPRLPQRPLPHLHTSHIQPRLPVLHQPAQHLQRHSPRLPHQFDLGRLQRPRLRPRRHPIQHPHNQAGSIHTDPPLRQRRRHMRMRRRQLLTRLPPPRRSRLPHPHQRRTPAHRPTLRTRHHLTRRRKPLPPRQIPRPRPLPRRPPRHLTRERRTQRLRPLDQRPRRRQHPQQPRVTHLPHHHRHHTRLRAERRQRPYPRLTQRSNRRTQLVDRRSRHDTSKHEPTDNNEQRFDDEVLGGGSASEPRCAVGVQTRDGPRYATAMPGWTSPRC